MDDAGGRRARSVVWVVLFTALLSCPLALLLLLGEAPQGMDGERDYARPEFSLAGFFSGEFQRGFENWFSTKYPLRTQIVEAYGVLDAGKDAFAVGGGAALTGFRGNASVIIGEEGYLYENGYINEYFGFAKKYSEPRRTYRS